MKRITLLLYFICHGLLAQNIRNAEWISMDTTKARLKAVAYWKQGEKKQYEVKKSRKEFVNDSLISEKVTAHYLIEIAVLDSTEKNYRMKWSIKENLLKKNFELEQLSIDPKLLSKLGSQELGFNFKTDEWGTFEEWEENKAEEALISEVFMKAAEYTLDTNQKLDSKEKLKTKNLIKKLYTPTAIREAMIGEPIAGFYYFHGYESGLDDTLRFEETLDIPQINSSIDLESYLYISAFDPDSNLCQFSYSKYGNPEQTKKLSKTVLSEMLNKKQKAEMLEKFEEFEMSFNLYSDQLIDLNTGWPKEIATYREIGTTQGDKFEIRQDQILITPYE